MSDEIKIGENYKRKDLEDLGLKEKGRFSGDIIFHDEGRGIIYLAEPSSGEDPLSDYFRITKKKS